MSVSAVLAVPDPRDPEGLARQPFPRAEAAALLRLLPDFAVWEDGGAQYQAGDRDQLWFFDDHVEVKRPGQEVFPRLVRIALLLGARVDQV